MKGRRWGAALLRGVELGAAEARRPTESSGVVTDLGIPGGNGRPVLYQSIRSWVTHAPQRRGVPALDRLRHSDAWLPQGVTGLPPWRRLAGRGLHPTR